MPAPVIVEVCQLIGSRGGPDREAFFLNSVVDSDLQIEDPVDVDFDRAAVLVEQYATLNIGYVDAVVVAIAERLGERRVATLDRRHFSIVKPIHVTHLELLP